MRRPFIAALFVAALVLPGPADASVKVASYARNPTLKVVAGGRAEVEDPVTRARVDQRLQRAQAELRPARLLEVRAGHLVHEGVVVVRRRPLEREPHRVSARTAPGPARPARASSPSWGR